MDTYEKLRARVALRCISLRLNPKATHIGSISGHVRQGLRNPDEASDEQIDDQLRKLIKTHRSHFGVEASLTAEQKLDLANSMQAKRESASRPADVTLTEAEQKKFAKLTTPELRNDFINVRRAAAQDAKKKTGAV